MRQRLGIAGALLRAPRLLLLDEPATGLDPAGMRDMRLLIRRLADDGMTVLLSSHLMDEVQELCNAVGIVQRGRMVYQGSLAGLLASAAGRYRMTTVDDDRAAAFATSCGWPIMSRSSPPSRERSRSCRWRWPATASPCARWSP